MTSPIGTTRRRIAAGARGLIILGIATVLALPLLAIGENSGDWVIPPGKEEVLGKVLGVGENLPGGCTLDQGVIQYSVINASYVCNGKKVALELVHPSKSASPTSALAKHFAITTKSGNAPDALLDALKSRMDAAGEQFAWERATRPEGESGPLSSKAPLLEGPMLYLAGAGALLAIGVFGFILRRA